MAFLYNFLQTFFLVSLLPIWVVLLVFNKRLRKGLVERLGFSEGCKEASYGPSIWVHAASLGEVKVSVPICEALAKRFPTHEMVFSASTPVGKKQARLAIKNAKKILTDSGGVQKEAYFLKVPCITLRDRTEWVETVEDRWNVLVGADKEKILKAIREFEPSRENYFYRFGDGKASKKIVEVTRNNGGD
jgi:hypothetical protein